MSRWRRFLIPIAVLCLNPVFSPAQGASSEKKATIANAQEKQRGLLLGIYFPNAASWDDLTNSSASDDTKWVPETSAKPHGHYLTFWISRRGDALTIQPIDGLLVPRAAGFWHIGTYLVKSDQEPEFNYDEQLWAVPAEQSPKRPRADAQDEQIDGRSVRLITYVGPEYLSYLFHWQGRAWEYVYPHVASLDDLAKDASIKRVLGSAEEAEFKRLAKSLDHMNEEQDVEPCNCCSSNENEWGIMHQGDSWEPYARFHYGPNSSCSQSSEDRVLKGMLPRNVSSGGKLSKSWDALRAEVEAVSKREQGSVRHIFLSPKQDLAVAISTHGLIVLGVENSHINSVLKVQAFDNPCIPVMEQWSVGRFVDTWDAAIQKEPSAEMPHTKNP